MGKKSLAVAAMAFMLAGCGGLSATQAGYEAKLEGLKGHHIDEVVMEWGPPSGEYTFADGRRMYSFTRSRLVVVPRPFYDDISDELRHLYCETRLITDKDGRVASWEYRGNSCRAVPPDQTTKGAPAAR